MTTAQKIRHWLEILGVGVFVIVCLACGGSDPAYAQQQVYAKTVSACGTPPNTPVTGNPYPVTQDPNGKLCVNATVTVSPGTPAIHTQTAALAAGKQMCAAACNGYSFEVSADATLSGAAWYVLFYDATSAPADGAVTPAKCFSVPSGTTQIGGTYTTSGVAFTTGWFIQVSTTGCFAQTSSAHAYIAGDHS